MRRMSCIVLNENVQPSAKILVNRILVHDFKCYSNPCSHTVLQVVEVAVVMLSPIEIASTLFIILFFFLPVLCMENRSAIKVPSCAHFILQICRIR